MCIFLLLPKLILMVVGSFDDCVALHLSAILYTGVKRNRGAQDFYSNCLQWWSTFAPPPSPRKTIKHVYYCLQLYQPSTKTKWTRILKRLFNLSKEIKTMEQKSRIPETKNLLTDAISRTNTLLDFFLWFKKFKK